jgi:hypothetical protein
LAAVVFVGVEGGGEDEGGEDEGGEDEGEVFMGLSWELV